MAQTTFIPQLAHTHIKRNKDGYWEIRWTVPGEFTADGKPRTRTYSCRTKDRHIAEDVRQAWLTAQHVMVAHAGGGRIEDLIDAYMTQHIESGHRSASQGWSLRPIRAEFGRLEVADLTLAEVNRYVSVRRLRVKDGTIRRELGALKAVLSWSRKNGLLPATTALPYIPLPAEGAARDVYLSAAEEERLYRFAAEQVLNMTRRWRVGLFTCIVLDTAARAHAVETLEWDRVDLARGFIDYRDPTVRRTKKRRVPVPIASRLRPILEHAARHRKSAYVLGSTRSVSWAFKMFIQDAMREHGIRRVTRHDLRRTWASLAAQYGVDMHRIAQMLGDTLATTERHYAHLSPSYLRSAVDARFAPAAPDRHETGKAPEHA